MCRAAFAPSLLFDPVQPTTPPHMGIRGWRRTIRTVQFSRIGQCLSVPPLSGWPWSGCPRPIPNGRARVQRTRSARSTSAFASRAGLADLPATARFAGRPPVSPEVGHPMLGCWRDGHVRSACLPCGGSDPSGSSPFRQGLAFARTCGAWRTVGGAASCGPVSTVRFGVAPTVVDRLRLAQVSRSLRLAGGPLSLPACRLVPPALRLAGLGDGVDLGTGRRPCASLAIAVCPPWGVRGVCVGARRTRAVPLRGCGG